MHLSYDYEKKPFGDWDNFRILPLFPVVGLPEAPDKQPSADIDLGSPRTDTAESRIKLPDGYEADLLDAIHIKTRFLSIDKTYSLENGELVVKRTVVVLQPKVPADEWMVYKKFVNEASLGGESFIQLTTSKVAATASVSHPPAAGNNPAAAQSWWRRRWSSRRTTTSPRRRRNSMRRRRSRPRSRTCEQLWLHCHAAEQAGRGEEGFPSGTESVSGRD